MINQIKSIAVCAALNFAVIAAAFAGKAEEVDYCKLSLETFPSYPEIAELALEADPLFHETLPEMRKKIRKSALAPRVRVEGKLGGSYYPEYGYESLTGTYTNGTGTQNYDYENNAWVNQGYNQEEFAQTYTVSLEWKLNNLMYHTDEEYAVYNYRAAQDYRLWQFNELANLYLEMSDALETMGSGEPDRDLRNTIQAAGAELDAMLGYHLRDVLLPELDKPKETAPESDPHVNRSREGSQLRKALDESNSQDNSDRKRRIILEEEEMQNANEEEN